MNIKRIIEAADKRGFSVEVDKTGQQYEFKITDRKFTTNPVIRTDRRGIELFIFDYPAYLEYCEKADIAPF